MPLDPTEYERATAIISHATITRSLQIAFPSMSTEDRDMMFVAIIDRMARMRGWKIQRERILDEVDGE